MKKLLKIYLLLTSINNLILSMEIDNSKKRKLKTEDFIENKKLKISDPSLENMPLEIKSYIALTAIEDIIKNNNVFKIFDKISKFLKPFLLINKEFSSLNREDFKNYFKKQTLKIAKEYYSKEINLSKNLDEELHEILVKNLLKIKSNRLYVVPEEDEVKAAKIIILGGKCPHLKIKSQFTSDNNVIFDSYDTFIELLTYNIFNKLIPFLISDPKLDINNNRYFTSKRPYRDTALIKAIKNDNKPIVELILRKKADLDINLTNKYNNNGLFYAIDQNEEIAKLILNKYKNKIDINHQNYYKTNALMKAIHKNKFKLVKIILNKFKDKIDINAKDKNGNTALIKSLGKDIRIIKILLKNPKIDIYIKNKKGQTAFSIAQAKDYTKSIKLLKELEYLRKFKLFGR